MTLAEAVKQKVEKLAPDQQRDVLRYVEGLEQRQVKRPIKSPRGILAGKAPDLALEEFQQVRREMW